MDIASISSALASVKAASDIAKLIKDSTLTLEQAEIKLKLADLISSLADARVQIAEIKEAHLDKDAEIRELRESLAQRCELEWEKPYYWRVSGETKEGPFCQHCYDTGTKLIRLQGGGNGTWHCLSCKARVFDCNYRRPQVNYDRGRGGFV